MNTQHQTPIQGTAMTPRLKPTERQTLGAVQSVNQVLQFKLELWFFTCLNKDTRRHPSQSCRDKRGRD